MWKNIIFIIFLFISCSDKPSIKGFGLLKLGMTLNEYNDLHKMNSSYTQIKELDYPYQNIGSIQLDSKTTLMNVKLDFDSLNKLEMIAFDFEPILYNSLKKSFGVKKILDENMIEMLNTDSDSIFLVREKSYISLFKIPYDGIH